MSDSNMEDGRVEAFNGVSGGDYTIEDYKYDLSCNGSDVLWFNRGWEASPAIICALKGRIILVGSDDEGDPRLVIKTTREEIAPHAGNLLYREVEVRVKE